MTPLPPICCGNQTQVIPFVNQDRQVTRVDVVTEGRLMTLLSGYVEDELDANLPNQIETNELRVRFSLTPLKVAILSKHKIPFVCQFVSKKSHPFDLTQKALLS